MKRGEIVIVAQRGHYEGKPRPAVIIQADTLLENHPSILVCQLSTDPRAAIGTFFRVQVEPTETNGLREDRVVTIERGNIRQSIGQLDTTTMNQLNTALVLFQGLA